MGYKYDIFISYKRDAGVRKWLQDEFIPTLEQRLQGYYADKVRIFFDVNLEEGTIPRPAVIDALKHSKIIIPILSPPYFESVWCSAEWKTFEEREAVTGLINETCSLRIPIRLIDCEEYGKHMGAESPTPREFNRYNHSGPSWRASPDYHLFSCEIISLAEVINQRLIQVQKHDDKWPLVSHETAEPLCRDMCHSLYNPLRL